MNAIHVLGVKVSKHFLVNVSACLLLMSGPLRVVSGLQISPPFGVQEVSQYLMVGVGNNGTGEAINLQKTEFGADQNLLSDPDPNLVSVFGTTNRWSSTTNRTTGSVPPSAPVFEGIDYTGQMAVTASNGGFSLSNSNIYADGFAARCSSPAGTSPGQCRDNLASPTSSPWFRPTTSPNGGPPLNQGDIGNGNGVVGGFDHSDLIRELENAWTHINGLTAELTISSDMENGSSALNIDAVDANADNVAVIDINRGGNNFLLNNFDWILDGSGDVFAIFRIRGNSNMLLSNSSIAVGPGGIGDGSNSNSPDRLGAVFVHYEEPIGNTDQVFGLGGNVILNGIGFWDLNPFRNGVYNDSVNTELKVQDGQGCSQFISSSVTFTSSNRFNRCSPEVIPEPGTVLVLLLGIVGVMVARRRQ